MYDPRQLDAAVKYTIDQMPDTPEGRIVKATYGAYMHALAFEMMQIGSADDCVTVANECANALAYLAYNTFTSLVLGAPSLDEGFSRAIRYHIGYTFTATFTERALSPSAKIRMVNKIEGGGNA